MRWLALAFVVWPVGFLLTLGGLAWTTPPAEYVGQIVMERAPFCDHFIVQTPLGYVTAVDLTGDSNILSGAQRVTGNLYLKGPPRSSAPGHRGGRLPDLRPRTGRSVRSRSAPERRSRQGGAASAQRGIG